MSSVSVFGAALIQLASASAPFAPQLDQASQLPDMRAETQLRAQDTQPIVPSLRSEFEGLSPNRAPKGPWVVRASYQRVEQLNQLLRRAAPWRVYPDAQVLIIDVQNLFEYDQLVQDGFLVQIDLSRTELETPRGTIYQPNTITNFPCYRTVEESYATAEALVLQRPNLVEWLDIGDSQLKALGQGGYDMRALRVTNRSIAGVKPVFYLVGSIHPREYAPAEAVTRFAEQLVQGYGVNPDITWMIDHHEIHLVLQGNPDGRKLAELEFATNNPLARKNRNPAFVCGTNSQLNGVDLNRNYAFDFAGPGSSSTICSLAFRGNTALSESESLALSNHARAIFPDQRAETSLVPPDQTTPISPDATGVYIDLHSNGAGNWFPWGNTTAGTAPNAAALQSFSRRLGFLNGLPGNRGSDFGAIGGATDDWTFGTLGVASMTIELGGASFQPQCSDFNTSIGPPAVASFFYAARVARAPYRLPLGPDVLGLSISYTASGATLTASANDTRFLPADPSQAIASVALFSSLPWVAGATPIASFVASDGSFNTSIETISATLTSAQLPPASNTLFFAQATDAAGNRGPVSAVFVNPDGFLFADGFE